MSGLLDIRIDTNGTLDRLRAQLDAFPAGVQRAQSRALRKLSAWVQRQVLREVSLATGATQKTLKALVRYRATLREDALSIWIGTNPLKVHHLGTVRWSRRMLGARAGRRSYPGAWAWSSGKTAGVVMQRLTAERFPIEAVTVPVHDTVVARLQALQPQVDARYQTLLAQELNYVLTVEQRRAA